MRQNSVALVLMLLPGIVAAQTPTGVVRGTVVNQDGKPVAGATVWAKRIDAMPHKFQKMFPADGEGRFTIPYLEWGQYRVYAAKESDGYADLQWAIHDDGRLPIVEISATSPIADVQVKFGPKAAVFTGSITDAVPGVPVSNATFRIWRWTDGVDRDSQYLSGNLEARYRLLIPPSKEVGIEFSAPGYETWTYCGESGGATVFPLNLASGAVKTLDIKLRPLPK
ncbi:MAG: carboxypeptidase-like regulatory domain-containing protein [Ignavibacteriota bacterium]